MSDELLTNKPPRQQLLQEELVEGLSRLLAKASDNQDAIVSGEIDELTREFHLVTKSGERQYVGVVAQRGQPGTDGISIIDVQLVEDPEQDNDVFIQTELSNGLVLQTRNSISGYHGKSLEDARIENNQIIFVLEGGVELEPVDVEGLKPISINGAYINTEREVILTLTDGTETPVGLASELKGRGIAEVVKEAGNLYVKYDDGSEDANLGRLVGLKDVALTDGELIVTNSEDEDTNLGPVVSITGAEVNEDAELIFHTNQSGDTASYNVGKVLNLRGDDGLSITAFDVRDNTIFVTLSDGSDLPPVAVTGLKPIHVIGAEFVQEENELYLELSNGDKITTGINADFKGDGIEFLDFNTDTGEISVKYTKEANATVVGVIPTLKDFTISPTGEMTIKWSHLPDPVKIGDLVTIDKIERDPETGVVTVTMNDESVTELGHLKSIEAIEIDGDDLIVTITGEDPFVVGSLRGEQGIPGVSITEAAVNDDGNLVLEFSDDSVKDVGYVRTTIKNFLGETRSFPWSDGPEFPAPHEGNVIVFVDNNVIPVTDLDLTVEDTVTYTGSGTFDDNAVVTILSFIIAAPDETGRGIFDITAISDTAYSIKLEDGSIFTLDTETIVDPSTLPPGIETAAIDPTTSMLTITKTDGEVIEVGVVNSSDNTESAFVDDNGELHIVLNSGKDMNVGSVVSNMTISEIKIDENGDLLIWLKGATDPFNAGPTANYVTNSYVDENDRLFIETSDGRSINAGTVRNPLLGTVYEFVGTEGQTKFRLDHAEYSVDASLQGIGLFKDQIDLTDPSYVTLVNPITRDGQRLKVTLMSKGEFTVNHLESAKTAPINTSYGVDDDGNIGFHSNFSKLAAKPQTISARNEGDTEISYITSGLIDVFKNGALMHSGYILNEDNSKIIFSEPLSTTDEIRVVDYSQPQVKNGLLAADYARVTFQTFSPGGTFSKGDWRVRNINAIEANQLGLDVRNNRIIMQPGNYYIRGRAACKGVGQNVLKLYDQTNGLDLLIGGSMFAPTGMSRAYQVPDSQTEISGYFKVDTLSSVILMHKAAITYSTYGFGSGNPGGGSPGRITDYVEPGRLVDLEIWKV